MMNYSHSFFLFLLIAVVETWVYDGIIEVNINHHNKFMMILMGCEWLWSIFCTLFSILVVFSILWSIKFSDPVIQMIFSNKYVGNVLLILPWLFFIFAVNVKYRFNATSIINVIPCTKELQTDRSYIDSQNVCFGQGFYKEKKIAT